MTNATVSTDPIVYRPRKRRTYKPGISALIDRATVELEATTDPDVIAIYQKLVAELEAIAFRRVRP